MLYKKLTALVLSACLVMTSCGKNDKTAEKNISGNNVYLNEEKESYYTAEKVETNGLTAVGMYNGEVIYCDGSWRYSVSYYDVLNSDEKYEFPSNLETVLNITDKNGKICCMGYNSDSERSIYTFSSDMSLISKISCDDNKIYIFSPDKDGNIIVCSYDEKIIYFKKYSENGNIILSNEFDRSFFDGESYFFPQAIAVSENGNIFFHYDNSDKCHISVLNAQMEFVSEIAVDDEIDRFFSENNGSIYVSDSTSEENVCSIYLLNESEMLLEYTDAFLGVDNIFAGTGSYDYFYTIDGTLYGYRISTGNSEYIADNTNPDGIFSCSGGMMIVSSNDNYIEELYAFDKNNEKRIISEHIFSDYLNFDKMCSNDRFQIVENNDEMTIYDIDIKNGDVHQTVPCIDKNLITCDVLVGVSDVLIYSRDISTEKNVLLLFDKKGQETARINDVCYITGIAGTVNGDYFLLCYDDQEENIVPLLLKSGSESTISFEGIAEGDTITSCCFSSEENSVYIVSENYIYSGKIEDSKCILQKIIPLNNIIPDISFGIDGVYNDGECYYVKCYEEIYKLIESDSPADKLPEKSDVTVINVLCASVSLDDYIKELFEEKYPDCRINCIEPDPEKGDIIDQINLMLISENVPDIILSYEDDFCRYFLSRDNSKNAYADLYEFMDSDPDYERGDFHENILKAFEYEDHLYQFTPFFRVKTLVSDSENVSFSNGWSISEFSDFLRDNIKSAFFRNDIDSVSRVALNLAPYYNLVSNSASFDTSDFKNMMETIKLFPEENELNDECLIYDAFLESFNDENYIRNCYFNGKKIENTGYPGISGNGALIVPDVQFSIPGKSKHAQEAWNLIKLYLSEDYYNNRSYHKFPVSKKLTGKYISETKNDENLTGYDIFKNPVSLDALNEESVEFIKNIIFGSTVIYREDYNIKTIFYENYFEYLDSVINVDDFAKKTQKKTMIYLSERY